MSETFDYDLVCIGSGPAGQRGAVQAAKLGRRVALIERRGTLGGMCLEKGTIPSKTFREAVLSLTAVGGRAKNGSSTRPTARELLARVEDVVGREATVVASQLGRNGVDVICADASFVAPHRLMLRSTDGWREITTDRVLIATGTTAAPPVGIVPDSDVVITSDDISQLTRLPRSLIVVGAGVIGIEYASMFAALGVEVTVVDRRERPLEFLDGEIVDELMHQMRNRNVTFRLTEAVASVAVSPDAVRRAVVLLESGKRIVADQVLISVGRSGATGTLGLETVGLTPDDRGRLVVDAKFCTSVPYIYAAGDVIGYPSLAATSSEQGRLAACQAMSVGAPAMSPHFPIGIYAVPEISMVGSTEQSLTAEKVPYEVGIARYREIARGHILGDDSGLLKLLFHRETRALLGVHIIGTGATELLHIGQAVLALNGGLEYFLSTVFNYPTLAECYKVAALNAANKLAA